MFQHTKYWDWKVAGAWDSTEGDQQQECTDAQDANKWVTSKRCVRLAGSQALQAQDNTVEDHLAEDEVLGGDAVGVQDGNYVSFNDSNLNDLLNSSEDELY